MDTESVRLEVVESETVGAIGRRKIPGANPSWDSPKRLMFCYKLKSANEMNCRCKAYMENIQMPQRGLECWTVQVVLHGCKHIQGWCQLLDTRVTNVETHFNIQT